MGGEESHVHSISVTVGGEELHVVSLVKNYSVTMKTLAT